MGKIYLITNTNNNMQYVGQTTNNVAQRFAQHIDTAYRNYNKNRQTDFYKDIVEAGEDVYKVFIWEILEQCDDNILDERELYWIKKKAPEYNWVHKKEFLSDLYSEEICKLYNEGYTIAELMEKYRCRHDEIKKILVDNNIKIIKSRPSQQNRRKVYQFDIYGNLVNEYSYAAECAKVIGATRYNVRQCAKCNEKCGYLKYSCNGKYVSYKPDPPYIFKLIDHNLNEVKLLKTKIALEKEFEQKTGKSLPYGQLSRKGRKTIYGIEVDKTMKEEYDEIMA